MDVLIVDDEEGIREGLAAFLRLRGHAVRTAADLPAALAALAAGRFDAVVSDWRLGAGVDAGPVLDAARGTPCLVASGYGAEVAEHPAVTAVLDKPVLPQRLLRELERAVPADRDPAADPQPAGSPPQTPQDLPLDVRAWLDAVRWLLGPVTVLVDDLHVTATATVATDPSLDALRALGGDVRIHRGAAGSEVSTRVFRDARPDGVDFLVGPTDPWPDAAIAVDLGGVAPTVDELDALLARIAAAGRDVALVNLPAPARAGAVALGWGDRLPMRTPMGPRIPADLEELWRPMP